jgi:L-lactate utilization protein LutC
MDQFANGGLVGFLTAVVTVIGTILGDKHLKRKKAQAEEDVTDPVAERNELLGIQVNAIIAPLRESLEDARKELKDLRKENLETKLRVTTANSGLVSFIYHLLGILRRKELKDLRKENLETKLRVTTAESRIEQLEKANSGLVSFIYHLLGILRHHDLIADIKQELPTGISL